MYKIERPDSSNERTSKPTETKSQGPNSLQRSLYGLNKGSPSGSTPEFLDAATEELQADFERTLVISNTLSGPRSMYQSDGNTSDSNLSALGERKGGQWSDGVFDKAVKEDNERTRRFWEWQGISDKRNDYNANTPKDTWSLETSKRWSQLENDAR